MTQISVYEYFEYRDFLKDFYEKRKEENSYFSVRLFATKVKIDPSYLVKVFLKVRHISNKHIEIFSSFMDLDPKEKEYFENLVHFNKARTDRESKLYFEKILSFINVSADVLTEDQYTFYQKWYYTAIRSLLEYYEFYDDYENLGKQLSPPISAKEAKESIMLLYRLGLIKKDISSGRYSLTSKAISTGERWRSVAIHTFQKETIALSGDSLDRHPRHTRDISTITMNINKDNFEEIQLRIKDFRESMIKLVNESSDPDRVYQLNIQLIPLTYLKEKRSHEKI
ncbi:hypothetical protein CHISP_0205 [Chitinispirillum alkaliphilum]|nr:hypothetical protein CHISP_0205 [Chitinispirillum alkaliphilum]